MIWRQIYTTNSNDVTNRNVDKYVSTYCFQKRICYMEWCNNVVEVSTYVCSIVTETMWASV